MDFSAILGLSKWQQMPLCVIISLPQLILHRLASLKQFRIHLKDPQHAQQTRTKICKMFFSWFNLPRIWNAAVDQELRSPREYPYFACYFFHSFKNIQKPGVVCPETKDSGSTISQSFEIPAVKHQECWKLQKTSSEMGFFTLSGCALSSVLGLQNLEAFWNALFLIKDSLISLYFKMKCFRSNRATIIHNLTLAEVFHDVYMEKAGSCTYTRTVIRAGFLKRDI